ncbi:MarR family winged helix-turn-helix transcriptional regulator [Microterricola viridarii]|uniref:DNA-binding transcriptional regulator, MarR family n=1 Tax=Microterricola viridarii TaxID=412690 RepID=A0A1H1UTX9_9MICO|nr:MarR family transcriptional regulator [Microterricola viridarii]SDS75721.1 DNA-binding transcriptional regulator, MarR family [Microterricola viridarii]
MTDAASSGALDRLRQLTVLLGRDNDESLARHGLSSSRAPVLWVISAAGPRTQRELAESLRVSARNVTGLVDALVADGFVSREPHPHDRRATLVTLTHTGKAVVAAIAREQEQFTERLFAGWARDELETFSAGLDRVVQSLRG